VKRNRTVNIKPNSIGPDVGAVIAVMIAAALLSGCNLGAPYNPNQVYGSGNVITEQRSISGVSEVVLKTSGDLTVEQNGTEALSVEGEDNILPLITTAVSGNRLTIDVKSGSSFSNSRPLRFHLSVKDIDYLSTTGSGNIGMSGVQSDRLQTEVAGSGNVTLTNVTAQNYTAKTTGSGGITASGSVEHQGVTGMGSGTYDGHDLQSKSAEVNLSGSGSATVRVSDTLDASVNGSGSVHYIGDPKVTAQDHGSGEIAKVR